MLFRNLMAMDVEECLFLDHVLQANEGCDFDFLRGQTPVRVEDTAGPSHA